MNKLNSNGILLLFPMALLLALLPSHQHISQPPQPQLYLKSHEAQKHKRIETISIEKFC